MQLNLLEIGQADLLSACPVALLLGVFTEDNNLERFLRLSRKMLNAKYAILAFEGEPYVWYSDQNGFKAFHANPKAQLLSYFNNTALIDANHPNYLSFSQHVHDLGAEHQRIVGFDLRIKLKGSLGQVVYFDDENCKFDTESVELIADLSDGLMKCLEISVEASEYKERYEQQAALNLSKTKFFQIIAHDLRAPFHGLLGFSEVLAQERDTLDDQGVQDIAEFLHDTAQSTYCLLESLLNWAMAEGGNLVYHPINFKLNQLVGIVCDVLKSFAYKKNIELSHQIPADLAVYADMNMMTSVVQNLVANALKFTHMDGSGKVHIQAQRVENGVELKVIDSGLGMSATQLEHIFEPQIKFSLKGTNGEAGTGLGLVLCKRFIALNHGEIHVTSKEGVGTVFSIVLPVAINDHQTLVKTEQHSIG